MNYNLNSLGASIDAYDNILLNNGLATNNIGSPADTDSCIATNISDQDYILIKKTLGDGIDNYKSDSLGITQPNNTIGQGIYPLENSHIDPDSLSVVSKGNTLTPDKKPYNVFQVLLYFLPFLGTACFFLKDTFLRFIMFLLEKKLSMQLAESINTMKIPDFSSEIQAPNLNSEEICHTESPDSPSENISPGIDAAHQTDTDNNIEQFAKEAAISAAGTTAGGAIGGVIGGTLGTAIPLPGIGTVAGAAIGALVGRFIGGGIASIVNQYRDNTPGISIAETLKDAVLGEIMPGLGAKALKNIPGLGTILESLQNKLFDRVKERITNTIMDKVLDRTKAALMPVARKLAISVKEIATKGFRKAGNALKASSAINHVTNGIKSVASAAATVAKNTIKSVFRSVAKAVT